MRIICQRKKKKENVKSTQLAKKVNTDRIKEELKDLADNVTSNAESKTVDGKWHEF